MQSWETVIVSHVHHFLTIQEIETLQMVSQFLALYIPLCKPVQGRLVRFLTNCVKVADLTNKRYGYTVTTTRQEFQDKIDFVRQGKPVVIFPLSGKVG